MNQRYFWRENVIAVVILLHVLARMSQWREQAIKCKTFYDFEGLTSFSINNRANFVGERKYNEASIFFRTRVKIKVKSRTRSRLQN